MDRYKSKAIGGREEGGGVDMIRVRLATMFVPVFRYKLVQYKPLRLLFPVSSSSSLLSLVSFLVNTIGTSRV